MRYAIAVTVFLAVPIAAAAQARALPRMPDGKPNLQGIWQVLNTASWDIQDHPARLGVPADKAWSRATASLSPEASRRRQNFENRATADPDSRDTCSVYRDHVHAVSLQILQTPDYVGMTFEYGAAYRTIYTNGTPHLQGLSISGWETRADIGKETRSSSMSCISPTRHGSIAPAISTARDCTWSNVHAGRSDHINYEVTVEDPAVFTRPWKMSMPLYRP